MVLLPLYPFCLAETCKGGLKLSQRLMQAHARDNSLHKQMEAPDVTPPPGPAMKCPHLLESSPSVPLRSDPMKLTKAQLFGLNKVYYCHEI